MIACNESSDLNLSDCDVKPPVFVVKLLYLYVAKLLYLYVAKLLYLYVVKQKSKKQIN